MRKEVTLGQVVRMRTPSFLGLRASFPTVVVFAVLVTGLLPLPPLIQAAGSTDLEYVNLGNRKVHPTRILAKFKDGVDLVQATNRLRAAGSRILRHQKMMPGLAVLEDEGRILAQGAVTEQARRDRLLQRISALQQTGLFEFVEPDHVVVPLLAPTDAAFVDGRLWGLLNWGQQGGVPGVDISATNAWDITTGSTNVIVAVIDTGIRYTHRDLSTQMWRNPNEIPGNRIDDDQNGYVDDVFGINAITGSGDPMDDDGHGTHVAGTIGAAANNNFAHVGVAWQVKLMALKFMGPAGGYVSDAIECIDYSLAKGAKISNNSWGSYQYSDALYYAIDRARVLGALFVAAAGNEANDNDSFPMYPASYQLDNIISVAAIDRSGRLADFSNFGRKSVHLGAPGVEIFSSLHTSDTDYGIHDGTSMAAPHVAGVAALIMAKYPTADLEEIRARILLGVVPTPALQWRTVTGGRLNAYNALVMGGGPALDVAINPPSGAHLLAGSAQPVFVSVRDPLPVRGANVIAVVAGVTNLVFMNNGAPPDAIADDAIYSAMLRVPSWTNALTMTVTVSATGKIPRTNVVYYTVGAPPTNDHFTNAIKVPVGGGVYLANNMYATLESGEPLHAGVSRNAGSLWWDYTPSTTTNVFVDPTGSAADTVVAVYTGNTLSGLQLVAATNDYGLNKQAYLGFNALAGQTYRIAVASASSESRGSIRLRIQPGGAPDITPPQVNVTAPATGTTVTTHLIQIAGTAVDLGPNISGVTEVQVSVNGARAISASGTTNWYITMPLREGANTIEARAVDAAGNLSTPVSVQVYCVVLDPPNDIFASAIAIDGPAGFSTVVTTNASKEPGEPNHAGNLGGKSVWWEFTPPSDGVLTLSTSNSTFDTLLALYTGSRVDSLSFVSANDDAGDSVRWSRIVQAVRSNRTYRIAVDGYNGASGTVRLQWAFVESPVCTLTVTNMSGGEVNLTFGGATLPLVTDVPSNATVTLRAVSDSNHAFDIWSGDVVTFANPLNLVVVRDLNLIANFAPLRFTDGFETGGLQLLPWTGLGDKPWFVQSTNVFTGRFAVRSGVISHSQTSSLILTAQFRGGTGSFAYRVSSEPGFDFLEFYVNGVLLRRWSGEVGWSTYEFILQPGTHRLEWRYTKDASETAGWDAAFIDNIVLPVVVQPDQTARARLAIKRTTDGVFFIEGLGQVNQTYVTQVSTNLTTWRNIATNIALDGFFRVIDYSSVTNSTRFYRAVVPAQ